MNGFEGAVAALWERISSGITGVPPTAPWDSLPEKFKTAYIDAGVAFAQTTGKMAAEDTIATFFHELRELNGRTDSLTSIQLVALFRAAGVGVKRAAEISGLKEADVADLFKSYGRV